MKISKNYKIIIISATTAILSLICFLIYTKFYYGVINSESLINHFIVCFNILILIIYNFFEMVFKATITGENIKIVIISIVLVYILSKVDISNLFLGVSKFEYGQLKFERDIAKLKELTKEEEENYERLTSNVNAGNEEDYEITKKIKNSEKRLEIIKLLISDPFLLKILISFIEGKTKKKTIPLNVLKASTTIDSVKLIFDYELSHNHIKITGIKKEIEDIIIKLYVDDFVNI